MLRFSLLVSRCTSGSYFSAEIVCKGPGPAAAVGQVSEWLTQWPL